MKSNVSFCQLLPSFIFPYVSSSVFCFCLFLNFTLLSASPPNSQFEYLVICFQISPLLIWTKLEVSPSSSFSNILVYFNGYCYYYCFTFFFNSWDVENVLYRIPDMFSRFYIVINFYVYSGQQYCLHYILIQKCWGLWPIA